MGTGIELHRNRIWMGTLRFNLSAYKADNKSICWCCWMMVTALASHYTWTEDGVRETRYTATHTSEFTAHKYGGLLRLQQSCQTDTQPSTPGDVTETNALNHSSESLFVNIYALCEVYYRIPYSIGLWRGLQGKNTTFIIHRYWIGLYIAWRRRRKSKNKFHFTR